MKENGKLPLICLCYPFLSGPQLGSLVICFRYQDTDEAVQTLPDWPTSLSNTRAEFESSETFLKTLNRHRFVQIYRFRLYTAVEKQKYYKQIYFSSLVRLTMRTAVLRLSSRAVKFYLQLFQKFISQLSLFRKHSYLKHKHPIDYNTIFF